MLKAPSTSSVSASFRSSFLIAEEGNAEQSEDFGHAYSGSTGLFDRREMVVGNLVGAGTYCQVHVVKAIQLQEQTKEEDDMCIQWTRDCIAKHTRRSNGEARYCIKFLKAALWHDPNFELAASALDNEIQVFKSLRHDHIAQIRGVARQGSDAYYLRGRHDSYFFIMDNFRETLEDRMRRWRTQPVKRRISNLWRKCKGSTSNFPSNLVRDPGLCDRMQIAFEMATALEHIHSQRIILRDVRPAKFGFTKESSGIQLFDVAMARRLGEGESELKNDFALKNKGCSSSAASISLRKFMAPELRWADTYDTKTDVFSFLSIVYELWTLKELDENVKNRQAILRKEPKSFQNSMVGKLLSSGWSFRTTDRPSMTMVCALLRTILRQIQDGTFHDDADKLGCGTDYTESSSSMSLRQI